MSCPQGTDQGDAAPGRRTLKQALPPACVAYAHGALSASSAKEAKSWDRRGHERNDVFRAPGCLTPFSAPTRLVAFSTGSGEVILIPLLESSRWRPQSLEAQDVPSGAQKHSRAGQDGHSPGVPGPAPFTSPSASTRVEQTAFLQKRCSRPEEQRTG